MRGRDILILEHLIGQKCINAPKYEIINQDYFRDSSKKYDFQIIAFIVNRPARKQFVHYLYPAPMHSIRSSYSLLHHSSHHSILPLSSPWPSLIFTLLSCGTAKTHSHRHKRRDWPIKSATTKKLPTCVQASQSIKVWEVKKGKTNMEVCTEPFFLLSAYY